MEMQSLLDLDTIKSILTPVELGIVQQRTGCMDNCDSVIAEFGEHPTYYCNGAANMTEGGSWIGHILPGLAFVIWSTHWLQGTVRQYYALKLRNQSWKTSTCFQLFTIPTWAESAFKVALPVLAMNLELWIMNGYRLLYCQEGEVRAGHLVGNHINNWQHAMLYPAFIASGIVDLIGFHVPLPVGTSQVFLCMAFVCEMLLLGLHKKHTPIDIVTHGLLSYSMMGSAVMGLCELAWPRNVLFTCGRIGSCMLQGLWLLAVAKMIWGGLARWDERHDDTAPAMYAPLVYVKLCLFILFIIIAAFMAGHYFVYLRGKRREAEELPEPSHDSDDNIVLRTCCGGKGGLKGKGAGSSGSSSTGCGSSSGGSSVMGDDEEQGLHGVSMKPHVLE